MGKKSKKRRAEALVEYLEPLSDISAIDIGVKRNHTVGTSYITGRFIKAENKRLLIKPYGVAENYGIYIDLEGGDIETLEVMTIRTYTAFGFNIEGFNKRARYDRLMFFEGGNVSIVGRFLKMLVKSMGDRKLKISTSVELRPANTIATAISASTIIGGPTKRVRGKAKTVVIKKKEFFFKEKLSEVSDENRP